MKCFGPSNFYSGTLKTMLTFLDLPLPSFFFFSSFLFPPSSSYCLPCHPPLLLWQALKAPSVTSLNQCVAGLQPPQPADEDFSWISRLPALWQRCCFFPCLLQTQLAELRTPSPTKLLFMLLLQYREEAEAITNLPYAHPMIISSKAQAALLAKMTLSVPLDPGDYISPLWSFIPSLKWVLLPPVKTVHWQHGVVNGSAIRAPVPPAVCVIILVEGRYPPDGSSLWTDLSFYCMLTTACFYLLITSILQCFSLGYLGIFPIVKEFGAFSMLWGSPI